MLGNPMSRNTTCGLNTRSNSMAECASLATSVTQPAAPSILERSRACVGRSSTLKARIGAEGTSLMYVGPRLRSIGRYAFFPRRHGPVNQLLATDSAPRRQELTERVDNG